MAADHAGKPASSEATTFFKVTNILDLPEEIQKEICNHCSQCDLICLSLVCHRFRELAAAQLYRNFHIVFPDEDDPSFDSPIDGLAGGLDTFVTSEYNYARHLRDLSLDTLSAGDKAEMAYKPYLYKFSCGKFMNTLLLLTLRKAKSLDTFRWNIRVELSRPVYKALHDIQTLRHLHLRLQSGLSLYETPPPLPYYSNAPINPSAAISSWPDPVGLPTLDLTAPIPASMTLPPGSTMTYGPPPTLSPVSAAYKPPFKSRTSNKQSTLLEPPTLSGFKNLESLSVLDIDSLDLVAGLKNCIRNSASTLTKLKLSFSDSLASQARKPCLDVDADDSDPDEDFQVVPMPATTIHEDGSGPAKVFRAQEERKNQELVLGRIFEVEPFAVKKYLSAERDKKRSRTDQPAVDSGRAFIDSIKAVSRRLAAGINGSGDVTQEQQDILDMIYEAAQKYVDSVDSKDSTAEGASSETNQTQNAAAPSISTEDDGRQTPSSAEDASSSGIAHYESKSVKTKGGEDETNPEDIDVAAPEDQLMVDGQDEPSIESAPATELSPNKLVRGTGTEEPNLPDGNDTATQEQKPAPVEVSQSSDTLEPQTEEISNEIRRLHIAKDNERDMPAEAQKHSDADVREAQHEMNVLEAEMVDAGNETVPSAEEKEDLRRRIKEYTRGTRGIALQSLSIHLIPVKASVLARAIDLRSLKRITLLNVGNQSPIWALMAKENKLQPLPLRKIFTDNVCQPFLLLASQLESLDELFMVERSPKYKPESFAPKTKVTMDQIRRLVLKKHMSTLKRLMIKNESDGSWDADDKTIQLICKRGKVLEELAVTMGMRVIHTLLQYLAGLEKLRALQIITLRNDDACISVMRETRRFIVDTVAHHPELKLEWISMGEDERAERILRKTDMGNKKSKKAKGKSKSLSMGMNSNPNMNDLFPSLPVDWEVESESEDDDADGSSPASKLELIENIPFYDVWDVKIFKKEIMAGRL